LIFIMEETTNIISEVQHTVSQDTKLVLLSVEIALFFGWGDPTIHSPRRSKRWQEAKL
jgi:hypothetical protein